MTEPPVVPQAGIDSWIAQARQQVMQEFGNLKSLSEFAIRSFVQQRRLDFPLRQLNARGIHCETQSGRGCAPRNLLSMVSRARLVLILQYTNAGAYPPKITLRTFWQNR